MQRPIRSSQGFTLIEIMIVVAIIGLLAAIAVPGFLRARKRSQSTAILNDARIIDGAIDQYAIENNVKGSATVQTTSLRGYFKPGSRLYNQTGSNDPSSVNIGLLTDILGGVYSISTFDAGVKVSSDSEAALSDVINNGSSFWGAYYQ